MVRERDMQFVQTSMSDEEIDNLLKSQGYGIVSLCHDGEPYSIPVSYGYDESAVYFPFLVTDDDATKMAFIEDGSRARFLVTDVRDLFEWQSVTVTDTVRAIDPDTSEWDQFIDALVENGWFRRGFEQAESIQSIEGWQLGLEEVEGRQRKPIRFE